MIKINVLLKSIGRVKRYSLYAFAFLAGLTNVNASEFEFSNFSSLPIEWQKSISGKVVDESGNPLPGASIVVKGTNNGTMSDIDGLFSLNVADNNATIVITFIGYNKKEIKLGNSDKIQVVLQASSETLDEVFVTGVFDKRTAMESSVAISVLKADLINRQVPVSATDLLKNVPGVYVNSSTGEIKNQIVSRGLGGYFYISVQEDGLPVTSAKYNNYGPDYFLRSDITLSKLEAVRGGTASILGNNAPGGIYNYVSKVGGREFNAELQAKYGLEGNGQNPYYRTDFNVGGPLSERSSITYNVGGFYREADGARYPGYKMNKGGQIKANLYMPFNGNGGLKIYAKVLDDRNSSFEYLPTVDFNNPKMAPGVEQTTSVLIPSVKSRYQLNESGKYSTFNSEDLIHSKDLSFGANLDYSLGKSWKFKNNFRFSKKSSYWNQTSIPTPIATTGSVLPGSGAAVLYGSLGLFDNSGLNVMPFGNVIFSDQASGSELMRVKFGASATGLSFTAVSGSLPGEYAASSLLFNPLTVFDNKVNEVIDQLMITKEYDNMSFTGGFYYSKSNVDRLSSSGGITFPQLTSPIPSLTTISYVDPMGNKFDLTNADGVVGGNGFSAPTSYFNLDQSQFAVFFGQNWKISKDLNLDWGVRYEKDKVLGSNDITPLYPRPKSTTGGTDSNPLTLYDNYSVGASSTFDYDKTISAFSYSLGLNYKISADMAVFGRFSQGELPADLSQFLSIDSNGSQGLLAPKAQRVQQLEGGLKINKEKFSVFLTPFYTLLSNVYNQTIGRDTDGNIYYTPVLFNKNGAYGIELENNINFNSNFSLRSIFTFQHSKPITAKTYDTGSPGTSDDIIIDLATGNTGSSTMNFRVSPTYSKGKFFSSVDWTYVGDRPANTLKAFNLPAFNQFDLSMGYDLSKAIRLQFNVNNIFNKIGVNSFMPPGSDPTSLNPEAFTAADVLSNPDAVYYTQSIPPRAYFLTASYKF